MMTMSKKLYCKMDFVPEYWNIIADIFLKIIFQFFSW